MRMCQLCFQKIESCLSRKGKKVFLSHGAFCSYCGYYRSDFRDFKDEDLDRYKLVCLILKLLKP